MLCSGIANKYNEFFKTQQKETDGNSSPSRETVSPLPAYPKRDLFSYTRSEAPILGNLNHGPFLKDYRKTGDPPGGIIPRPTGERTDTGSEDSVLVSSEGIQGQSRRNEPSSAALYTSLQPGLHPPLGDI